MTNADFINYDDFTNDIAVNEDAEAFIEGYKEKKLQYKNEVLSEVLTALNDICKDNEWKYFAVKELLTNSLAQKDLYPDLCCFEIVMMREDYDPFVAYVQEYGKKYGIKTTSPYGEDGSITQNINFQISKKAQADTVYGSLEAEVAINVIPYDYLPDQAQEREQIIKEFSQRNVWYCGLSRYAYNNKGKNRSWKTRVNLLLRYNSSYFKRLHEEYKKQLEVCRKWSESGYCGRMELMTTEAIEKKRIFPVSELEFLNTVLMTPADTDFFALLPPQKKEEKQAEIRGKALQKFDKFCTKNKLSYFAMESLLVESVKQEFLFEEEQIWKVGMLRQDYEKMVQLLKETKEHGLILKDTEDQYPSIETRLKGILLEGEEQADIEGKTYPVLIEPFDYLPQTYGKIASFKHHLEKLRNEHNKLVRKEKGLLYPKAGKSANEQLMQLCEAAQKYKTGEMVFRAVTGQKGEFRLSDLFPVQRIPFGNGEISIPANEYLWREKGDQNFIENLADEKTQILKSIDRICREQNIEYFAMSDLLVGIVVYRDIMPNGENKTLAVGLVRREYERLLKYLRQEQSDLVLEEFKDNEKKYPLTTKFVTLPDSKFSEALIQLIPLDKIPEAFYTRRAFREEMREYNKRYRELLDFSAGNIKKYKALYTEEEIEEKSKEYSKMDAVSFAAEIERMAQRYNEDEQAFCYERVAFFFSKIIDQDDLYPLQRKQFRNIELNCPRDYSVWQPIQDAELQRQVTCIQKADLKLIKEFDRVCQELGLGYFVCGGTMLGYMRHKGFIPWDDDVDVAMLRADYDRFLSEAPNLLGKEFFLQIRETDPTIPYLFSKIRLNGTEYCTEYNKDRAYHKGICLDIFPFDYVPNDLKERELFVKEVIGLAKAHHTIANNQLPEVEEPFEPRNEEERRYREEQRQIIQGFWSQSLVESQKKYIEKATMYNEQADKLGLKTVASFVPSYTYIDLNDLLPYQRGKFEGIDVFVPKRPDIFLEMQYGNYMELPPLHMRVAHRLVKWSDGKASADNQKKRQYNVT